MDNDIDREIADLEAQRRALIAADVAKSVAVAPAKAAVGLAGLPGDLSSMTELARGKLAPYLPEWMQGLDRAASNLSPSKYLMAAAPTSAMLRAPLESLTGKWYEPTTGPGKVADTGAQIATTMGRNLITKPLQSTLLTGGMTGGTEVAGSMSGEDPWMRFLGGLAGGSIPALFSAARGKVGNAVRDVVGGESQQMRIGAPSAEDQVSRALAQQNSAQRTGVPLLGSESFDNSGVLATIAAQDPKAAAMLRSVLSERPTKIKQAATSTLLAPTGPMDIPTNNAARAQTAATDALTNAERGVSSQSGPLYRAAANDQVPAKDIAALVDTAKGTAGKDTTKILSPIVQDYISRLTTRQATPAVIGTPGKMGESQWLAGTPDIPAVPAKYATDVENLDRIRKYFRDRMELAPFANEAIPKEASKTVLGLNADLKSAMAEASPQWSAARELHQKLMQQNVEPLLASGVGKLAGKGYDPAAFPAVERMPAVLAGEHVRPENIRTLWTTLNAQDRQAFPGMVQSYLDNEINKAVKPSANAGPALQEALAGTEHQRAKLDEMLRGVAHAHGLDPNQVMQGAKTLLDVLERAKTIVPENVGQAALTRKLGHTLVGDVASTASFTPLHPWARRFDRWVQGGNYQALAKALTDENSVQVLARMAKLKPDGMTARFYAAQALGLDKAINGQEQ